MHVMVSSDDEIYCCIHDITYRSTTNPQTYWHINVMRWVLVAIIGVLTGAVGTAILFSMEALVKLKYSQLQNGTSIMRACVCVHLVLLCVHCGIIRG